MKHHLLSLRSNVWGSVTNRYQVPITHPTYTTRKKVTNDNARSMNAILSGLQDFEYVKAMHFNTVKETWDKLQSIYEGDDKVEQVSFKLIEVSLKI